MEWTQTPRPAGMTFDSARDLLLSYSTVMNDFAYPLIIAHSGAERGPLIKISRGTAGLLHLWQTPSMPQQPRGTPGGIGFKRNLAGQGTVILQ